jgi:hypothetical protein
MLVWENRQLAVMKKLTKVLNRYRVRGGGAGGGPGPADGEAVCGGVGKGVKRAGGQENQRVYLVI